MQLGACIVASNGDDAIGSYGFYETWCANRGRSLSDPRTPIKSHFLRIYISRHRQLTYGNQKSQFYGQREMVDQEKNRNEARHVAVMRKCLCKNVETDREKIQ